MTHDERIAAVAKHSKLTRRQAGFLVMVMVHSGVCVRRQYCTYAHIRHGQKVVDFFSSLVTGRAATRYIAADGRARIFHVHGRTLYAAIDEPHNRNRKPITLGRAVERLMLLDAVLAQPELRWLGTATCVKRPRGWPESRNRTSVDETRGSRRAVSRLWTPWAPT